MTAIYEALIGRGAGILAGPHPVLLLFVPCAVGLTAGTGPFTATDDSTVTTTHVPAPWTVPAAVVTQRVADIHGADTRSPLTIIVAAGVTWEMGPAATSHGASAISVVILSAPLAPVLQGPLLRLCCPGYLIALVNNHIVTLVMHLRVTPPPLLLLGVGWLTRLADGMLTSSGAVLFWSSSKFRLAVPVLDHPNWLLQRHDQGTVVGENRDAPLNACHHVGQDLSTWSGR